MQVASQPLCANILVNVKIMVYYKPPADGGKSVHDKFVKPVSIGTCIDHEKIPGSGSAAQLTRAQNCNASNPGGGLIEHNHS